MNRRPLVLVDKEREEKKVGDTIKEVIPLGLGVLFTLVLFGVGEKFYDNEVSNVALGITILVSSFLAAPFFFLMFYKSISTFGVSPKLSFQNYIKALGLFTVILLTAFMIAFTLIVIANFKI